MKKPDELKAMAKKAINTGNYATQSGMALHRFIHSFDWLGLLALSVAVGSAAQGFIGDEPYQWSQNWEKYVICATVGFAALGRHLEAKRERAADEKASELATELAARMREIETMKNGGK